MSQFNTDVSQSNTNIPPAYISVSGYFFDKGVPLEKHEKSFFGGVCKKWYNQLKSKYANLTDLKYEEVTFEGNHISITTYPLSDETVVKNVLERALRWRTSEKWNGDFLLEPNEYKKESPVNNNKGLEIEKPIKKTTQINPHQSMLEILNQKTVELEKLRAELTASMKN